MAGQVEFDPVRALATLAVSAIGIWVIQVSSSIRNPMIPLISFTDFVHCYIFPSSHDSRTVDQSLHKSALESRRFFWQAHLLH